MRQGNFPDRSATGKVGAWESSTKPLTKPVRGRRDGACYRGRCDSMTHARWSILRTRISIQVTECRLYSMGSAHAGVKAGGCHM